MSGAEFLCSTIRFAALPKGNTGSFFALCWYHKHTVIQNTLIFFYNLVFFLK